MLQGIGGHVEVDIDDVIKFDGRLYIPRVGDWIQLIVWEAYDSPYSILPGTAKIY